jgi:hypothetical protein
MYEPKTLFVVGAGASQEAGLPTGNELTATIAEKVDIKFRNYNEQYSGELEIAAALRFQARNVDGTRGDINPYLNACWHIRDAMPQAISIDSFIDHQGDDKIEFCGKLAIVRSILEAEKNSLLFVDERQDQTTINFNALEKTWYKIFMQILSDGCHRKNINQIFEGVSFIVFNYDRCIEHFLFHALQNYYGIQSDEAADILQELTIIHPYGMVGRLQWQGDGGDTRFGTNADGEQLLSLVGQIKTYTERIEDEKVTEAIRQLLGYAKTVMFLGFSFHGLNMKLIKPSRTSSKRVFATAKGMSDSDCDIIVQQIVDLFDEKTRNISVYLKNGLTCRGLFEEYLRSLSRS